MSFKPITKYFSVFSIFPDIIQHVKSEQCKIGEITNHNNEIRNPHSGSNLSKVPHPYTSLSYPNQHYMNPYPAIKDEMVPESKNAVGIPIPASKPKIWSLADTAACKTPPPVHTNSGWASNLQHSNRQHGIGSMAMGVGANSSNSNNVSTMPNNMQSLGTNTIINNFTCSPYNRYGGFLPGNHQLSNNIGAHSTFMNMVVQQPLNQILNNSYDSAQHEDHGSNNQLNNIRNLHHQHGLGFSEIQTDTPPQTPPNQKHPCNTANNMQTPPVSHANVTCFSNNNNINHMSASTNNTNLSNTINQNNNNNNRGFSTSPNSNSYADNFSQMPQNSPQPSNVKNAAHSSNLDSTAFKPFFKR